LINVKHDLLNPAKEYRFPSYMWLDSIRFCGIDKISHVGMYKFLYRNKTNITFTINIPVPSSSVISDSETPEYEALHVTSCVISTNASSRL